MTAATLPPSTPADGPRRGADLLVECLVAAGVDTLFGVPGDTGVVFYDALSLRADRIRHILARDERHAAKMADAYARTGNRVGAVEVSSGGGTTFAVGGLGEAYAAGVPVLLITSDIHTASRGSGALTEIDQLALFSAVTKWRALAEDARDIPALLDEALRQATTGRPAPVALVLPENVLDQLVEPAEARLPEELTARATALPRTRPAAEAERVREAARALSTGSAPAALVGSGIHVSEAHGTLAALAERLAMPVATTIHGKGAIPDSDPWSAGPVGNNGARAHANTLLAEADVVLLVGTRANATDTNSWTGPSRNGPTVIQIDVDADRAGRNFPGSIPLVGDADTVLAQLLDAVDRAPDAVRQIRREELRAANSAWEASLGSVGGERATLPDLPDEQLLPSDIVRILAEELGPDTLVVADPGTPTPNTSVYWRTRDAGRTVIVPRGHGPMGYAIPAAVGASLARPDRRVVALTADGSFAMACGELETIARLGVPVLYVQFTNNSLGWIKMLQHLYTERRYFGVDPGTIDAVAVAEACGVRGIQVRDLGKLRETVREFAASPAPLYVDVQVPHMIDHLPPVPAWEAALAGDTERPVY
ncbi:thiamine pyrophosphate-binding protein [Streptomyces sp. AJS327]|uniref:thiamine pyrophosphate-binding protein n=1 Tax=Streptomyces sp. AJS327 TaxID=2545265 RepID=UPI0015DDDBFD|nr:thiamine pyrophosphate-binding protein [Streptomyces sp. AJS327]MBA0050173.1 thiamine pyrophosphate-binding protein [Streptomyces sp. AJS327]